MKKSDQFQRDVILDLALLLVIMLDTILGIAFFVLLVIWLLTR